MKTTKFLLLSFFIILGFTATMAQVSINNPNPHPASILDLSAPGQQNKGVKLPKGQLKNLDVTTVNGKGMMLLDTTTNSLYVYDGADWQKINVFTASSTPTTTTVDTPVAKTESKLEVPNGIDIKTPTATLSLKIDNADQPVILLENNGGRTTVAHNQIETPTLKALDAIYCPNYYDATGNLLLPKGVIVMWSGTVAPAGWALCDGTPGRPDLRGRFIVGYNPQDSDYSIRKTGPVYSDADGFSNGSNTTDAKDIKLTIGQMPSHNHEMNSDGEHTHKLTVNNGGGKGSKASSTDSDDDDREVWGKKISYSGDHKHYIWYEGGSQAHENRPPYYTLAYIIKL